MLKQHGSRGAGNKPHEGKDRERNALIWKTSDWITQEIGLAIGKGLNLILLIEDGVRNPGGLQGNIEYIAFQRASPEEAFGKLLEMIRALLPRSSILSLTSPETASAPAAEEPARSEEGDDDWPDPNPDWRRIRYEI